MPLLERRVAREVSNCLSAYAAANFGRYPWASNVTNITTLPETINGLFGRIPDQPLTQSRFGNVPVSAVPPYTALVTACTASPASCMQTQWPIGCNLPVDPTLNSWWNNWKLQVFYGVADAYKPQIVYTQPTPATVLLGTVSTPAGCPACVTVNPPSATADKQFVVMVAGRSLPGASPGQARNSNALRRKPENYLEGENNNSDSLYTKQPGSTTFNDTVVFSPP